MNEKIKELAAEVAEAYAEYKFKQWTGREYVEEYDHYQRVLAVFNHYLDQLCGQ